MLRILGTGIPLLWSCCLVMSWASSHLSPRDWTALAHFNWFVLFSAGLAKSLFQRILDLFSSRTFISPLLHCLSDPPSGGVYEHAPPQHFLIGHATAVHAMISNAVLRKRIVAVEVPAATTALVVCASQLHSIRSTNLVTRKVPNGPRFSGRKSPTPIDSPACSSSI